MTSTEPPGTLAAPAATVAHRDAGAPSIDTDIVVIGAGQAGLSTAYHLARLESRFVVLDQYRNPGGAWQFRWPSLTLRTVNGVHDLPGMPFVETTDGEQSGTVRAAEAVPRYYAAYESRFGLHIERPRAVTVVREVTVPSSPDDDHLAYRVDYRDPESGRTGTIVARGLVNATGTWEHPFVPFVPGIGTFRGEQLHTKDYATAERFAGKRVLVVGGGISAVQFLSEISLVTETVWVTRRPVTFTDDDFGPEAGRAAVALVEDRVRRGLPPGSVVSVTGLRWTDALRAAAERGALDRLPMFDEVTPEGVRWDDGRTENVDVILWATGFRSALDHLAPLRLRGPGGGITMTGRLATAVAGHPRLHLVGYGPSASTIGANRAGRAAATEILAALDRHPDSVTSAADDR